MIPSTPASSSPLSTTISQVAAKNPAVGIALARATVSASLLSGLANGGAAGAGLPGSPNQQSTLTGAPDSQADPTLQIVNAVNAHLGQNFNVKI